MANSDNSDVIIVQNNFHLPSFVSRDILPSKRVPKDQQSIWSIIKNAIGKDLSRLTTPIVFNEPLSFIQRLAEYMENSHLLCKAVACTDSCDRLEYVGAFAASTLSSLRISKPFNPLLFETYELEKPEMGFRFVAEQVSHHPPVSAFHAVALNGDYELYGSVAPKLKFWGRFIECDPRAFFTLKFPKLNQTFTWKAVNFTIHNIIFGEIFMSLSGTMIVKCHQLEHEFRLHFKGAANKGPQLFVTGEVVLNKQNIRAIYGNFCTYLASCPVDEFQTNLLRFEHEFRQSADSPNDMGLLVLTRNSKVLWQRYKLPPNSNEYYDFSYFDMLLNEMPPPKSSKLPPTDSRYRLDMRSMEDGDFEKASKEKKNLEDKQRARAKNNSEKLPKWFIIENPDKWKFTGEYWNRNFNDCETIF